MNHAQISRKGMQGARSQADIFERRCIRRMPRQRTSKLASLSAWLMQRNFEFAEMLVSLRACILATGRKSAKVASTPSDWVRIAEIAKPRPLALGTEPPKVPTKPNDWARIAEMRNHTHSHWAQSNKKCQACPVAGLK